MSVNAYVTYITADTEAEIIPATNDRGLDLRLTTDETVVRLSGSLHHIESVLDAFNHQLSLIKAQRATAHPAHQKARSLAGVMACRDAIRGRVTDSGKIRTPSVSLVPASPRVWRKVEVEVDEADFFTLRPSVGDVLHLTRAEPVDASTPATGPEAA